MPPVGAAGLAPQGSRRLGLLQLAFGSRHESIGICTSLGIRGSTCIHLVPFAHQKHQHGSTNREMSKDLLKNEARNKTVQILHDQKWNDTCLHDAIIDQGKASGWVGGYRRECGGGEMGKSIREGRILVATQKSNFSRDSVEHVSSQAIQHMCTHAACVCRCHCTAEHCMAVLPSRPL